MKIEKSVTGLLGRILDFFDAPVFIAHVTGIVLDHNNKAKRFVVETDKVDVKLSDIFWNYYGRDVAWTAEIATLCENTVVLRKAHPDKNEIFEWTAFELPEAGLDEVFLLVGFDASDKHRMSKERNDLESRLQCVIDSIAGNHWWKDKDGVYRGYNKSLLETLGLQSMDQVIGKKDSELPWKSQADDLVKNDNIVMINGKMVQFEEDILTANGEEKVFMVTKVPLRSARGEIIGTIGSSFDITEKKRYESELRIAKEKAELANELKTEFILNMEHDIRTPFSGIWGLANYLWEKENDPEKKEFLGDITHSAKELLGYCNGILDFSKIESEGVPILNKKFDLFSLIDSIVLTEMPAAKHRGLDLSVEIDDEVPFVVMGDDYRLRRVLINLLSNAIKFTSKGSVKLLVSVVEFSQESKLTVLRLTVKDTGMGIPDDKIRYIYEKFSRLSRSNKGLFKGLGLGLTIVRQFIYEMEGEIEVNSVLGEGTTVTCTLPFGLPLAPLCVK